METTSLPQSRQHFLKALHQIEIESKQKHSYACANSVELQTKTAGQLPLSFHIVQTQCKCQRSQTVYLVQVSLKWTNLQSHKTVNFACSNVEAHLGILEYQICSSILSQTCFQERNIFLFLLSSSTVKFQVNNTLLRLVQAILKQFKANLKCNRASLSKNIMRATEPPSQIHGKSKEATDVLGKKRCPFRLLSQMQIFVLQRCFCVKDKSKEGETLQKKQQQRQRKDQGKARVVIEKKILKRANDRASLHWWQNKVGSDTQRSLLPLH